MTTTSPLPLKISIHKHPQMESTMLDHDDDDERNPPRSPKLSTLPSHHSGYITRQVSNELNLEHCTDLEIRPPGPGEVVVKLLYSGICRTDGCFALGEPDLPQSNLIVGHESLGTIVLSPSDLTLLHTTVVTRFLVSTCNTCNYCIRHLPESCPHRTTYPALTGTMQEYITVPYQHLRPLPPAYMTPPRTMAAAADRRRDMAPLYVSALCSGAAALKSLRTAAPQPGDVVVVSGVLGAIGHLVGMIAKKVYGVQVIGVDLGWKWEWLHKEKISWEEVCDAFIPACECPLDQLSHDRFLRQLERACAKLRKEDDVTVTTTSTPAGRADSVIVCASSAAAFQRLEDLVRDGGSIVVVGAPRGPCMVQVPLRSLLDRQLRIQGSLMGTWEESLQVMQWIHDGIITPYVHLVDLADAGRQLSDCVDCKTFGKGIIHIGA
ncbi:hypothetical protein AbraIFM66951_005607 [Aspergillus brasiliensis]|nr:hypothetical protein AbraIFM66951_005607 [Aspergillus brasiliensis]